MAVQRRTGVTRIMAVACAWGALGGVALGANATISVGNDKTVSPASPSILAGDTVTWHWVGPDTDHIIESAPGQAEAWDSDPGVADNDVNHSVGDTFAHLFTQSGAFSYRCRIHPDKMFGTITVGTGNPIASFTVSPTSGALVGQVVNFDGMGSSDPGGVLVAYDWDLDGNGSFETSGATTSRAYSTAGTVVVSLRVTDNAANTHTTTRNVVISDPPPPPPVVPPLPSLVPVVAGPTTPPVLAVAKLALAGPARQSAVHVRGVAVTATCDLGCSVTATGSIALPGGKKIVLTRLSKVLAPGVATKLVLVAPKPARATLRGLLAKGRALTAKLTVTSASGATATKRITLVR